MTRKRFTDDEVDELLARAVELQADDARYTTPVQEVEEIASEIGVPAHFVQAAIQEKESPKSVTPALRPRSGAAPTQAPIVPQQTTNVRVGYTNAWSKSYRGGMVPQHFAQVEEQLKQVFSNVLRLPPQPGLQQWALAGATLATDPSAIRTDAEFIAEMTTEQGGCRVSLWVKSDGLDRRLFYFMTSFMAMCFTVLAWSTPGHAGKAVLLLLAASMSSAVLAAFQRHTALQTKIDEIARAVARALEGPTPPKFRV